MELLRDQHDEADQDETRKTWLALSRDKIESTGAPKVKVLVVVAFVVVFILRWENVFLRNLLPNMESSSAKHTSQTEKLEIDNNTEELDLVYKPQPETQLEPMGGLYFCGYGNFFLGRALFPDYWARHRSGLDHQCQQHIASINLNPMPFRQPTKNDILMYGLHGPCNTQPRDFPGKVLFLNGEPHGPNMPATVSLPGRPVGEDVYQMGLLADSQHSILAFHGAWNLQQLDESLWANLWEPSRKQFNTGRYHGLVYMNGNCVEHREAAVRRISNILPIYYGGRCNGKSADSPRFQPVPNPPPGRFWTNNIISYHEYKFCMSMENSQVKHYMSEKIIIAFLSGCIPVYWGSEEVFDIFNHNAFIWYDPNNPTPALKQIEYLSNNDTAYQEMLTKQPIMANGEESVRDYFSFSDRIADGHLKNKLRKLMALTAG